MKKKKLHRKGNSLSPCSSIFLLLQTLLREVHYLSADRSGSVCCLHRQVVIWFLFCIKRSSNNDSSSALVHIKSTVVVATLFRKWGEREVHKTQHHCFMLWSCSFFRCLMKVELYTHVLIYTFILNPFFFFSFLFPGNAVWCYLKYLKLTNFGQSWFVYPTVYDICLF